MKKHFSILCFALLMLCALAPGKAFADSSISNPVYYKDTDSSTYSYVYFGRYPQSEVKGEDLTTAIKNGNYNKYGYAIVNGKQYCRMKGSSEMEYYRVEPLRWKVLSTDGNTMLLQTDMLIDSARDFNRSRWSDWKTSELRSWLNGYSSTYNSYNDDYTARYENFHSIAFTESEYETCMKISLTQESKTTNDYIAIPSYDMVFNNIYGFSAYGSASSTRKKECTDYLGRGLSWVAIGDSFDMIGRSIGLGQNPSVAPIVRILEDTGAYSINLPSGKLGTDLSEAEIDLSYYATVYDGSKKCPKPVVYLDGKKLVQDVDYTLDYAYNVNAGQATAIIKGAGSYYGTAYRNYTIKKANQKITNVPASINKIYSTNTFRLNAESDKGTPITYRSSKESVAILAERTGKVTMRGIGVANITVTAKETQNYKKATKTVKLTVNLDIPRSTSGNALSKSSLKLKWKRVPKASGYKIYKFNTMRETYSLYKTIKNGATTSLTIKKLSAGKKYKYKLKAYTKVAGKTYESKYTSAISVKTLSQ